MNYLYQQLPDGRIVIQDYKGERHKYINTPNSIQAFTSLEDLFDWLTKNAERLPWVANQNQYAESH